MFVKNRRRINKSREENESVQEVETFSTSEPLPLKNVSKTWTDQQIEIIESLEKDGIDIYDDTRRPGMYVMQRLQRERDGIDTMSTLPEKLLQQLVGKPKAKKVHTETSIEEPKDISPDLLAFLMK